MPRYIRTQYGEEVSRRTVFNWVNVGRKGVKLRVKEADIVNPVGGPHAKQYTTNMWVDDFLKQVTEFR